VGASILLSALFVAISTSRGIYGGTYTRSKTRQLGSIARVWVLAFLIASMAAFLLKIGHQFSRGATVAQFVLGLCSLMFVRHLADTALRTGLLRPRRIALLHDADVDPTGLHRSLAEHGYRVVASMSLREGNDVRAVDELAEIARNQRVDDAFIIPSPKTEQLDELISHFCRLPVPVHLIPSRDILSLLRYRIADHGAIRTLEVQAARKDGLDRAVKRALDVAASAIALVCLWPIFLIVALAIKLDSPGPVFFAQNRVGFNGRTFRIFKFRSMTTMDDGAVVRQAQRQDPRVTSVGRWLRSTSLDELPQLFNVLLGDMSLVGPRPHALAHDRFYSSLISDYPMRHHMKPGITGLAQVSGCRGETETPDLMARRVAYDLSYIGNWSLWLDLKILARTVSVLAHPSKVY
jgi:Undecaprenyl-phosphate glucose phosphotransferase